jgi:hypothetical protein
MATTAATAPSARAARRTSRALIAGALAGPLFFASAVTQMVLRDGFDITRHPISQLATGELGWIQIVTFVLAGLGGAALAVGLKRTITEGAGRRALPVLVAIFGVGLVAAGLLPMDPENGFPAGTPEGPVARMSWHGALGRGGRRLHRPGHRGRRDDRPVRAAAGRPAGRAERRRRARPAGAHVTGSHEPADRPERPGRLHLDGRRRAGSAPPGHTPRLTWLYNGNPPRAR